MRILCVVTGSYGTRIASYLAEASPEGWEIEVWEGPDGVPQVLDDPEPFLPVTLPQAELMLSLAEDTGVSDLAADLADRCGAEAVIAPMDRTTWLSPGLSRQLARRLEARGMGYASPSPFCTLHPGRHRHPLIEAFAEHFGAPDIRFTQANGKASGWKICRGAPCGCTKFVVGKLAGVDPEKAVEMAGLLHHYYPCLAAMEVVGTQSHPLLHQAAKITCSAVSRALSEQMTIEDNA